MFVTHLLNQFDMKSKIIFLVIALFAVSKLFSQATDNCVTSAILSGYSQRSYSSEPVTDQQLELILKCGIKAPSARNIQPWKFTVIKDEAGMKEIINDVIPGNVLVIISGIESENGTTPDFDCGLATESMFVSAHSLGLGARIYGSPTGKINSNKELFQIPSGYKAVIVLRIGNTDKTIDAISAATPRKKFEEVVNYKK
ncbi:MAG TPA: nitroreductase family protein, partial [Draconibacterium sp.]|nr:nitroreductase family protein [Draconibacterium sp.]